MYMTLNQVKKNANCMLKRDTFVPQQDIEMRNGNYYLFSNFVEKSLKCDMLKKWWNKKPKRENIIQLGHILRWWAFNNPVNQMNDSVFFSTRKQLHALKL